jgi:prepilin-type processing-associated H-X9-DG protein/prepilin-type N-terminal cleavage/methylation domain-containing protein
LIVSEVAQTEDYATMSRTFGWTRVKRSQWAVGFTLIELLVVVSVIGLLVAIMIPFLSRARSSAKATLCTTRLRTMGQGLVAYANEYEDCLVPGRMPKPWVVGVEGGMKYRPTFLAMMESQMGIPPFAQPLEDKELNDDEGQPGDRQNYASEAYVCPEVPAWVDERNGCYGYNYQFLGNARLRNADDPTSYKNWANQLSRVKSPATCVAVADCMGTAASYSRFNRLPYEDNEPEDSSTGRSPEAWGNEGFNLDPPRVDLQRGEMALFKEGLKARSAIHERHSGKANTLRLDGHVTPETLRTLGYAQDEQTGVVLFGLEGEEAHNRFFHPDGEDLTWIQY